MKTVIISGSARNDGDTKALTDILVAKSNWDVIDLNDYNFSYFDYEHQNANDEYLDLMRHIIDHYDTFVFATPVYWYAMSGIMKVFFDRLTDVITIEKELGRRLRTKHMAAISCSIGNNLGDHFWLPFSETARYLGMQYLGNLHTISGMKNDVEIQTFIQQVERN